MSWLHRHLNQKATHWALTGADASGDSSYATPVTIDCRWEERNVVFTNAEGEEAAAAGVVFTKVDVDPGDMLFLGSSSTVDPASVEGTRRVEGVSKIPQLTGSEFEHRAFLSARGRVR